MLEPNATEQQGTGCLVGGQVTDKLTLTSGGQVPFCVALVQRVIQEEAEPLVVSCLVLPLEDGDDVRAEPVRLEPGLRERLVNIPGPNGKEELHKVGSCPC